MVKTRKSFYENSVIYSIYNQNSKKVAVVLEANGNCYQFINQEGKIFKKLAKCAECHHIPYLKDLYEFRNLYTNLPVLYTGISKNPNIRNVECKKLMWRCSRQNCEFEIKYPILRSSEGLARIHLTPNCKEMSVESPMLCKINGRCYYYPIQQIISLDSIPENYKALFSLYFACIYLYIYLLLIYSEGLSSK